MAETLIQIGPVQMAAAAGNAYSDSGRSRRDSWRWAAQPVVGGLPDRQFTGRDAEMTLAGTIYADIWTGNADPVEQLREAARTREPQELVQGDGAALGLWTVEAVEERRTASWPDGSARAMEWSVRLRRYRDAAAA